MKIVDSHRARLLEAAAERFIAHPFAEVSMVDIAADARLEQGVAQRIFSTTHDAASAVLEHERASMHAVQGQVAEHDGRRLDRIVRAFVLVGESLANDVIIRAGVCLTSGSRQYFPERRLDPYRTWMSYINDLLNAARACGELRDDIEATRMAWIIVTAGMGTMDFARTQDSWMESPVLFQRTALGIIDLIAAPSSSRPLEQP